MPCGEKILVIRGGAIGDFILTLPVLSALSRHFPKTHLEILGYPRIASLAQAAGLAQRVSSIEAPTLAGFFVNDGVLAKEFVSYFCEFNLIISYLFDPEQIFQSNVARCCDAKYIAGPHRPDEKANIPAAEALLKPLEILGIAGVDPFPRLLRFSALFAPSSRLAIHPGSGSEQKNWPEEKWLELLNLLVDSTDWDFLLIGGEAEESRFSRMAAALPPSRCQLAYNLPLAELAEQMRSCFAFIGHDSGISHLAAAINLPGLILWGPSNEHIWRPQTDKIKLLRNPAGLSEITVAEVFEATRCFSPAD